MTARKSRKPRVRPIDPPALTGAQPLADVLRDAFPAFAGRGMREAHRLMRQSLLEDHAVFCTVSGAMTPAGMHQSCLIPMIEAGMISCLTTTGANLYHDLHRTLGYMVHEVNPYGDDTVYRKRRTIRIFDVGFDEQVLLDTDAFFVGVLRSKPFQRAMTTAEMNFELGRVVAALEDERRVARPSLLATCFRHGVPIFVGAPQDGSIFLNVVKMEREDPKGFRFRLDASRDVYSMAALQNRARARGGQASIWIFGGGVPKNYTLQGEPMLSQILGVDARGFDIDVQVCVDVVDNGALSSCTAGEAHTWGKTSAECVESRSIYLRTDVTVALPILTSALLSAPELRRPSRRLYDALPSATKDLDALWLK
ncbi:MAG TPA: deoxyhypusine synthase family protein [Planctomycetota bacterium]|nr:deoxyhypusine synthase family protein [Planctomycetota bacterium]